jgi:hypothetical protein
VAGADTVVATSVADPTKSARATVTVPVSVRVEGPTQVRPGSQATFIASVLGSGDQAVTWSVAPGGAGGTIDQKGTYVAPANIAGFDTILATSAADPAQSATLRVTIPLVLRISVSDPPFSGTPSPPQFIGESPDVTTPSPFSPLFPGNSLQFSAQVVGSGNQQVLWSVEEPDGGSISGNGLYDSPRGSAARTVHVIATSPEDQSVRARIAIVLDPAAG